MWGGVAEAAGDGLNLQKDERGNEPGEVCPIDQHCPFCTRDPKNIGRIALENEHCLFLDRFEWRLPGSGIIIPKAHRPTVFDLTPDEWAATYDLLIGAKEMLAREFRPEGFNVGWNCGEVGGQSIPHAHLHVIPRFADEPFAGKGIRHWLKSEANRRPGAAQRP